MLINSESLEAEPELQNLKRLTKQLKSYVLGWDSYPNTLPEPTHS